VILVVAEERRGTLNRASAEAIAAAQQFASGFPIKVLVPGASTSAVVGELSQADVAEIIFAEHASLGTYTPDAFTVVLKDAIERTRPAFVVMAHTYQARDFAPMLAARLRTSLITDVTGIVGEGASAAFVRPMFQGKLAATVRPRPGGPSIVTFQIGAFRADAMRQGGPAPITSIDVSIDAGAIRQKPEAPFQEAKQAVDLGQAERIVAVGRGIKSQDNLPLAQNLAKAMGAEVAASRPICDSGWLPMERQVGSSGQTVAPKLYVALGISGAIQHLVGMKGSRTIVAINKDPDAPIFEVADYGIVGDLFEIVPALTAELEKQ
jgi:electron transfer flavoprotein alpha subunit